MLVEIDAIGQHTDSMGRPRCHMIVDRKGCLVDLANIAGPLTDPKVFCVQWGPYGVDGKEIGRILRKNSNNATSLTEIVVFTDKAALGPYLAAHKVQWSENNAGQS